MVPTSVDLPVPQAGLGVHKILSFFTHQVEVTSSQAGNGTQSVSGGVESQAHPWTQVQVVLRDSSRRTEAKVLQQSAEEDEELHLGQTFSQTHPATCERQQRKRPVSSAKKG